MLLPNNRVKRDKSDPNYMTKTNVSKKYESCIQILSRQSMDFSVVMN